MLEKWINKIRASLLSQYVLYLIVACLVSILLGLLLSRDARTKFRTDYALILSDMFQLDMGSDGVSSDLLKNDRILRLSKHFGMEMWIADSAGQVLASTGSRPMPVDWSRVSLPAEEMTTAWTKSWMLGISDVCVVRLVGVDLRYLVFYFTQRDAGMTAAFYGLCMVVLWVCFVSSLGTLFVLRTARKPSIVSADVDRSTESGFSLLSALVALVVAGVLGYTLQQLLASAFRSGAHSDLRQAIRSLSDTVKNGVDCAKTFEGVKISEVCTSTPKPLLLRNSSGSPITEPLLPDSDTAFAGAGKVGNWYLKATCEPGSANLVVQFARKGASQASPYFIDPLTKQPFDWSNKGANPLFGTPDRVLCEGASAGAGREAGAAKGYGLLGVQSFQKRYLALDELRVANVPTNTKRIKVSMVVVNLGVLNAMDAESHEDSTTIQAMFNVASMTSTGYFSLVAGKGANNVALFAWHEQPPRLPIVIDGDSEVGGIVTLNPTVRLAARWRPVFRYNTTAREFALAIPDYFPAAVTAQVEFYGD